MADGPELAAAKRLLDLARDQGLVFQRVAPGEDRPLLSVRESPTTGTRSISAASPQAAARLGRASPP